VSFGLESRERKEGKNEPLFLLLLLLLRLRKMLPDAHPRVFPSLLRSLAVEFIFSSAG
jgi:hypothetical protein